MMKYAARIIGLNLQLLASAAIILAGGTGGFAASAQPPVRSQSLTAGAVAAPDRFGAEAARIVLSQGGNAVDAAVATAFAVAVTYPEAGNIGGGGFMTLYVNGKPYFLDYRETAPGAASADMYLGSDGEPNANLSLVDNLATAVPGTVRGLAEAHRRFGKLSWKQDLAPAIALARDGFIVPQALVRIRDVVQSRLGSPNFTAWASGIKAGRRFRQPKLARTLQRIAANGADEFYKGETARLIVAQMKRGRTTGIISLSDLASYKAVWRDPLKLSWHGFTVYTAPPPSSGGIALLQMLGMKQDAAPTSDGQALNSPQYIHLVSEIEKRVFADRAEYLGDPDYVQVPVTKLLDADYIARRAAEIDPEKPSPTRRIEPGLEKPQTTHFSIVDHWGNAVSNTYTLNGPFGSGVVVEGAGFLLNDEMDDFSAKPGAPNQFGVVGGNANAIGPGKRPLSSMTPTILTRDNKVVMAIGTPGGSRIFTSVFQVLVDIYDFHLPLKAALAQPRYHHQLVPENVIFAEPYAAFPKGLGDALVRRGYALRTQDFNGDIAAVQIEGRQPVTAPDPRGRGVAILTR